MNILTVKDRSPLPYVEEAVNVVATENCFVPRSDQFFCTKFHERSWYTSLCCQVHAGLHKWVVIPMGQTNAPETQHSRFKEALGELVNFIFVVWIDDMVIPIRHSEITKDSWTHGSKKTRGIQYLLFSKKDKAFQGRNEISGTSNLRGLCSSAWFNSWEDYVMDTIKIRKGNQEVSGHSSNLDGPKTSWMAQRSG